MSDDVLPILVGVGAVGGLLWYGSKTQERLGARSEFTAHAEFAGSPPSPSASPAAPAAAPAPAATTAPLSSGTTMPASASSPGPVRPSMPIAPTAPEPLRGRWVWPVEMYQGRKSIITNPWSMAAGRIHRGVDILFARTPGDLAGGRALRYPPDVERWRHRLETHAPDLASDFLLTWVRVESGGNPCAVGISDTEAGLFQSFHPADDRHGATFAALRTACAPGTQTAQRALTDEEQQLQVAAGISLVRACIAHATNALHVVRARWSPVDVYCAAKLVHALPAYVVPFLRAFTERSGRPPVGWKEFRAWVRELAPREAIAISAAVRPWASVAQRDRLFGNAEEVGGAVTRIGGPYIVPPGVRALAASDGVVWSAERTPRGFAVVIDHSPAPYATFYTHLATLSVRPTQRAQSAERVYAGQPLGEVGADPTDVHRLPHLHFEIWRGGPREAIDPGPLMRAWEHVAASITLPRAGGGSYSTTGRVSEPSGTATSLEPQAAPSSITAPWWAGGGTYSATGRVPAPKDTATSQEPQAAPQSVTFPSWAGGGTYSATGRIAAEDTATSQEPQAAPQAITFPSWAGGGTYSATGRVLGPKDTATSQEPQASPQFITLPSWADGGTYTVMGSVPDTTTGKDQTVPQSVTLPSWAGGGTYNVMGNDSATSQEPQAAPQSITLPSWAGGGTYSAKGGIPTPSPGTARSTSLRNAQLTFQSVGKTGEPYPDWVRALDGQSGVYVIREIAADGTAEIVYVGQSGSDRLYDTMTRHFQIWRRWKRFWRDQYTESGHDPGLTYNRGRVEAAAIVTPAGNALDEEARLIAELRPRDNIIGQPDDVPF